MGEADGRTTTPESPSAATLTEFLMARIAEDADAAAYAVENSRVAWPHKEKWQWIHFYAPTNLPRPGWSTSHHEGVPTPKRVLAECEAKRRIVNTGEPNALRFLAAVYADHPDYQESWRR